jgi:hypothetical protein
MHAGHGKSEDFDAESERIGLALDHGPHGRRQLDHVFRQSLGQRPVDGGSHDGAMPNRTQRVGRILGVVVPGTRVRDSELHGGIDGDQVAAVAKQKRIFVGGMLARPQHVLGPAVFFGALVADCEHLHSPRRNPDDAIDWPGPVKMDARLEGRPLEWHTQALHEGLLFDLENRHRRREPPDCTKADDKRLHAAPDDGQRPRRSEVDAKLTLRRVEHARQHIVLAAQNRQDAKVQ